MGQHESCSILTTSSVYGVYSSVVCFFVYFALLALSFLFPWNVEILVRWCWYWSIILLLIIERLWIVIMLVVWSVDRAAATGVCSVCLSKRC